MRSSIICVNSTPTKKIVLAGDVFDLLHCGHVDYLQRLKHFGDTIWRQLEKLKIAEVIIGERPLEQPLRSTTDIITHVQSRVSPSAGDQPSASSLSSAKA